MNPLRWSFRTAYLLGFLACAALLGYALYAEFYQGLQPCNLCVLQRVAFVWMGLFFLIGGLHAPRAGGRRVYVVLVLIGALFGIYIAGYQLWLSVHPEGASCGAEYPVLMQMVKAGSLPYLRFLALMFSGTGDCARIPSVLGLPMAAWTLIWYVLLGVWALWPRPRRDRLGPVQPIRALGSQHDQA